MDENETSSIISRGPECYDSVSVRSNGGIVEQGEAWEPIFTNV